MVEDKEPDETTLDTEEVEETPETLRETVEKNFDAATTEEVIEPKGERLRDDSGKFVAKNPEIEPEPVIEPLAPPTSWKKDHHERWGAMDRQTQEYINQRESEFASGVSTYKSEYDRLKPLDEAISPFMEDLRANNIDPGQWIHSLGTAHKLLASGQPQEKLSMFMKLANDYQVPVDQLFAQRDGKVFYNPQVQPHQAPPPDINKLVEDKFAEFSTQQAVEAFTGQTDSEGNLAYPHLETVRETMAQLLEAGLADDLSGAYKAALRHPRHVDIFDAELSQKQTAAEAAKKAEIKKTANIARRNTVSTNSATPKTNNGSNGKGTVRGSLEDAFDDVMTERV
jgi:hypothetical protein